MLATQERKYFSSMSSREMFSLWWQEKWVRYLVIALSPIGFVDAVYTMILVSLNGPEYEYNPIVRAALTSSWWPLWFIADVVSFSLFAMIAGSYYLHTRSKVFGVRTGWLTGLVALRVGAASFNVLRVYSSLLSDTMLIPSLGAIIMGVFTYILVGGLLSRNDDVSIASLKSYFRAKYDRFHDRLLTRGLTKQNQETTTEQISDVETAVIYEPEPTPKIVWVRRVGYLSMAVVALVSLPYLLVYLALATGLLEWREVYGGLPFFNDQSALPFLMGFALVLVVIGAMTLLISKSFEGSEGQW